MGVSIAFPLSSLFSLTSTPSPQPPHPPTHQQDPLVLTPTRLEEERLEQAPAEATGRAKMKRGSEVAINSR